MHFNSELSWGGAKYKISHYKEDIGSENFPIGYLELEMDMSNIEGNRYFIIAQLIDDMNCRSPEGNFTFNGE